MSFDPFDSGARSSGNWKEEGARIFWEESAPFSECGEGGFDSNFGRTSFKEFITPVNFRASCVSIMK